MKVLYVVESSAPYGANMSLIDLIDSLREKGVLPLVVGSDSGPLGDWLKARSIVYHAVGHKLSIYPKSETLRQKISFAPKVLVFRLLNLRALFRLVLISLRFQPDIIHTNIGPSALGYWTARILRIKHVWHLREYQDLDFNMHYFPSQKRFLVQLGKSDSVICITKSIAKHFLFPGEFRVINDGVSAQEAIRFNPEKEKYFLFAGRLEAAKGVEDTIMGYFAFCAKYGSSYKMKIAGSGSAEYVEKLKTAIKSSPFSENVQFLGFRNDTLSLMGKAKALIVASHSEGFGRITPEAMFNGCLVIGRNVGGTADILQPIQGKRVGLLFDNCDSLVNRMIEAVTLTPDSYRRIVSRAQAKAVDRYCIERHGSEVYSVYQGLLSSRCSSKTIGKKP